MLCQSEDLGSNLQGPYKKPGVTALFFNIGGGGQRPADSGGLRLSQPGFNSALPAACPKEERLTATEENT